MGEPGVTPQAPVAAGVAATPNAALAPAKTVVNNAATQALDAVRFPQEPEEYPLDRDDPSGLTLGPFAPVDPPLGQLWELDEVPLTADGLLDPGDTGRSPHQVGLTDIATHAGMLLMAFDSEVRNGLIEHRGDSKRHVGHVSGLDGLTFGLGHFAAGAVPGFFQDLEKISGAWTAFVGRLHQSFDADRDAWDSMLDDSYWGGVKHSASRQRLTEDNVDWAVRRTIREVGWVEHYRAMYKADKKVHARSKLRWIRRCLGLALSEPAVAAAQIWIWRKKYVWRAEAKALAHGVPTLGAIASLTSARASGAPFPLGLPSSPKLDPTGDPRTLGAPAERLPDYPSSSAWVSLPSRFKSGRRKRPVVYLDRATQRERLPRLNGHAFDPQDLHLLPYFHDWWSFKLWQAYWRLHKKTKPKVANRDRMQVIWEIYFRPTWGAPPIGSKGYKKNPESHSGVHMRRGSFLEETPFSSTWQIRFGT